MLLLKDMAENSIDIIFAKPCVLGNSFDFSISISIMYFFVIPFSRYLALFIIWVVLIVISTIPCACFYYTTFSAIVNGFIVNIVIVDLFPAAVSPQHLCTLIGVGLVDELTKLLLLF